MGKKKKTCLDCIHAGKLFGPYVFCKLAQENHEYDNPCSLREVKSDKPIQKKVSHENSQ